MLADLRFSIRSLARRRGYSAVCVITLGLATSVTFAALALVDAALLRPIPLTEPARVVTLHTRYGGDLIRGFLYPELERVLELTDVFEVVAGDGSQTVPVITASGAQLATVSFVTDRFFDVVGLRPALGRGFATAETRPGADPVVIVTDAFWRTRLGGDSAVIGRTIRTGGRDSVVVGVLPKGFRGLDLAAPVDFFMHLFAAPLVAAPMNFFNDATVSIDGMAYSPSPWISITARLKEGASVAGAEVALSTALAGDGPDGGGIRLVPTARAALPARTRAQVQDFVNMLAVASGLILLAGCANVAVMMLVRQERRRREMAVRSWLGAGRLRIMRLFLIEAMLLTSLGAVVGLQIAMWLVQAAVSFVTLPGGVEMTWLPAGWTGRMAGLGALAAVVTGVVCGLAPALQSMDRYAGRSVPWRGIALAGQVAVVVVLTIGAGLFIRSMWAVAATDIGVDSGRLSYATVYFGRQRYEERLVRDFYHEVLERLAGRPEVEAVTFGNLPLVGNPLSVVSVEIDGDVRQLPARLEMFLGGPEYVRTVGLRLLAGRDFGSRDVEGGAPVAIVNESLARHLWRNREAIGEGFTFLPLNRHVQVVGVVGDGRYGSRLRDLGGFAVFLPWEQNRGLAGRRGAVIGRTNGDAGALAVAIQQEIRALDGDLPIVAAGTFRDRLGVLARPQRVGAVFLSGLGGFSLLLAVVGVYGSVTQTTAARTREIGIRIALGASRTAIVGTVLSGTLVYLGIGVVAGAVAAGAFGALAEPHLFEVDPRDPMVYVAVTHTVVAVAVLAGLAAALGASRKASVNKLIREVTAAE